MIKGLEHVGLSVSDLDRSIPFYRDLLGMRVIRVLECAPESGLGNIVGLPGCRARIAHLQSDMSLLELFEYQQPRGQAIPPDRSQADRGFIHAGFATDDIQAEYARLKQANVEFVNEPIEFRPRAWVAYFRGPDGEMLELRQTEEAPRQ